MAHVLFVATSPNNISHPFRVELSRKFKHRTVLVCKMEETDWKLIYFFLSFFFSNKTNTCYLKLFQDIRILKRKGVYSDHL